MSIYNKKYQIFVSSTYTDLIRAREEVIKVILNLYQIPIGMEMFSADNNEQWSIIKNTIENSDYYILILGHRYGSVTKENISYTEKEFDYAKEKDIPIISFVRNRDYPTKPSERDRENSKVKKLEKFHQKVLNNSICDFWENENELGQKVAIALTKIFFKTPRTGWIRSDRTNPIETTEELTNLIQENRNLKDELNKINSVKNKELPKISAKINNKKILEIEYVKYPVKNYRELKLSSIPNDLKKYVSDEQIENYNNAISEKKSEIEKYEREFHIYKSKKKNNKIIKFEISNIGKSKANNIYIDFKFPQEVLVFEKVDLEELKKPNKPKIPKNPLNYALNPLNYALRKKNKQLGYFTMFPKTSKFYGGDIITQSNISPTISSKISSKLIRNISSFNRNVWVDQYKNQVTIKLNNISHTRTTIIDDNILVTATKAGKFEITVNIICDEFKEPQSFSIPVEVK